MERHLITLPHCLLPKRIPHFPSEDDQSSAQLLPFPSTAPKHPAGLKQLLRSHSQKRSARRCLGNHRRVAVSEVLTSYKHTKGVTAWHLPLLPASGSMDKNGMRKTAVPQTPGEISQFAPDVLLDLGVWMFSHVRELKTSQKQPVFLNSSLRQSCLLY